MSPRVAPPPSPVVDQVRRARTNMNRSWSCLRWSIINAGMAFIFFLEVYYGIILDIIGLKHTALYYLALALSMIFCLNAIVDFLRYLHLRLSSDCPEINEIQRRLLAVQDNEFNTKTPPVNREHRHSVSPVFTLSSARPASVVPNYSPQSLSHPSLSPQYSYNSLYNGSMSPNLSYNQSLSMSHHGLNSSISPLRRSFIQPNPSPFSATAHLDSFGIETLNISDSPLRNRMRRTSPRKEVMDMTALEQSLREGERLEHHWAIRQNEELHNPYSSHYAMDLPHFPYQITCRSPQSVSGTGSALSDEDSNDTIHGEEVWRKLRISSYSVDVWVEKLRHFLGQTIMSRVSREIVKLNKQLRRLGLEETEIGEVSIPTLKQVAITKTQHLRTLNSVIQFLDVTVNQQYLVARIHELGKGGCMSDFNWNGGMDYKSKPWAEHLPTDCAIVMHCLCTYLDARLPPHPKYPDGRTFTSQHFLKLPDKPSLNKDNLIIYQTKINPPHFKVIYKDQIWDIPKGRNNMFQAILLFLHFIKTKDGMLDRVSLGMSGINILWVLDD